MTSRAISGMIYGIIGASATVLKIDPTTARRHSVASLRAAAAKPSGGVRAISGMIYGIP